MIASMTGYAHITREIEPFKEEYDAVSGVSVELRSVNARFLDLNFRIADEARACEPAVRAILMQKLRRGKVEIRIGVQRREAATYPSTLNSTALARLIALEQQLLKQCPQAVRLSVADILRWRGVLAEKSDPGENPLLHEAVMQCAQQALAELVQTRAREGAQLGKILLERVTEMERCAAAIASRAPELRMQQHQKTIERLLDALSETAASSASRIPVEETAARIRQEVTLYGMRIDVSEELARLSAHLTETRRILDEGGPVGKRLDFMMQELNREANTLGAKAAAKELADASMTFKLLIEQMREQIQNLE